MFKKNKKIAFSLVELIVVLVILAILWILAFLWIGSYTKQARDAKRLNDVKLIYDKLNLYYSETSEYPLPEEKVEIKMWSWVVWYQWRLSEEILKTINYDSDWKDPTTNKYFTYYVTPDKQYSQLMIKLEDENWKEKIKVEWKLLWILTDKNNTPINEIQSIKDAGWLDILNTTDEYIAHISEEKKITWSWQVLRIASPTYNCSRLFDIRWDIKWYFDVNYNWETYNVFCDSKYADKEFYDFVVWWDMEYDFWNFPTWWEEVFGSVPGISIPTLSVDRIKVDDAPSWEYVIKVHWRNHYTSNYYTYIDKPNKTYEISWFFKWEFVDNMPSYLCFWFIEYDRDFKKIWNSTVNIIPGTETTLAQKVKPWDMEVKFYCDNALKQKWVNWEVLTPWKYWANHVAFEIDDSSNYIDLPNHNLSQTIWDTQAIITDSFIEKSWNICTLNFNNSGRYPDSPWVWEVYYPAWTKIRFHSAWWGHNYRATNWVCINLNTSTYNNWAFHHFSWTVDGVNSWPWVDSNYFRKWTKFVKPYMALNYYSHSDENIPWWWSYLNPTSTIYIDDLKLEVVD